MKEQEIDIKNYCVDIATPNGFKKGETITLCGMDIVLPKKPDRSKIRNYQKVKRNQKWDRSLFEQPEGFSSMPKRKQDLWWDEELDRREYGLVLYINGKPTYITGSHYFYLMWSQIDIGYPDYRDRDRRFFTFWEACCVDPNCYGMHFTKNRREGLSWKGASIAVKIATENYNAHCGFTSKTGTDAKSLFKKAVHIFRKLPSFYQPQIDGTDNPKTALVFDKPGERITKTNNKVKKSNALGSQVSWRNTAENSYDSEALKYYLMDEGGKWETASAAANWDIVKPAMQKGRKIYGKALLGSTVNEMTKGGGENYKKIYDKSDVNQRSKINRTTSGLYRYFVPAYDGLEGFIDEFGNSVIETPEKPVMGIDGEWITLGAKEYLDGEREAVEATGDDNALAELKRQYPYTPEEAYRTSSNNCHFNAEKLYQQLDWLDIYEDRLLERGNFVWKDGFGSQVVWKKSRNGRWLIAWKPEDEDSNLTTLNLGKLMPGNYAWTVSGVDPYDHNATTSGKRSDAACYVFRKFNLADPDNTNMFVSEYIARPSNVHAFYEDMLKQCIYYGCQILVENNKPGLINYFVEKGYKRYLMNRPESTHTEGSKKQKIPGLPTSGQTVINSIVDAIEMYVDEACGWNPETGQAGKVYFRRLLNDWLKFEADNRTDYDASMASGITLLGTQKKVLVKKKKMNLGFVKKYKQNGITSKRI
jgi:hypothetical protein